MTNNDGINITTREVLDITDEVKLKDASVRVYDNVSVLTGSITSVPSTLLSLFTHIGALPNGTQLDSDIEFTIGNSFNICI